MPTLIGVIPAGLRPHCEVFDGTRRGVWGWDSVQIEGVRPDGTLHYIVVEYINEVDILYLAANILCLG